MKISAIISKNKQKTSDILSHHLSLLLAVQFCFNY